MKGLKMHRYVLGWVGLFVAFAATYPVAMMRVSQTQKFIGQPLNSQTCQAQGQRTSRKAISWMKDCSQISVKPLKQ